MKKAIRYLQNYLLFASPFVIGLMGWATVQKQSHTMGVIEAPSGWIWEILSWNLMLWFAGLLVFLILLVVMPTARENTIHRLANLKERDEREQQITGKASKAAYISTLSLLMLLLFFSIFSFNVSKKKEAINGKHGEMSITAGFSLWEDKPKVETDSEDKVIFESQDLPLTKTAILLLLIIWQLAAFNITARKENLVGE